MTNSATEVASPKDLLDNARGIVRMPAFLKWKEDLDGQIKMRTGEILKPATKDSLAGQEYMKGEIAGIMLATQYWNLLIEVLDAEVSRKINENEEN